MKRYTTTQPDGRPDELVPGAALQPPVSGPVPLVGQRQPGHEPWDADRAAAGAGQLRLGGVPTWREVRKRH